MAENGEHAVGDAVDFVSVFYSQSDLDKIKQEWQKIAPEADLEALIQETVEAGIDFYFAQEIVGFKQIGAETRTRIENIQKQIQKLATMVSELDSADREWLDFPANGPRFLQEIKKIAAFIGYLLNRAETRPKGRPPKQGRKDAILALARFYRDVTDRIPTRNNRPQVKPRDQKRGSFQELVDSALKPVVADEVLFGIDADIRWAIEQLKVEENP